MRCDRAIPVLLFCVSLCAQTGVTNPEPLRDKAHLTVRGRLHVEFVGWASYVVVIADRPYTFDFGDSSIKKESFVEVRGPGLWDEVKLHPEGESVTASGRLDLDDVTPYRFNGVVLDDARVERSDGSILSTSSETRKSVPAETTSYLVTVKMMPRQLEWPRTAIDLSTKTPMRADRSFDSCGLNGGGDVLNCFCADGFVPMRAGFVRTPYSFREITRIPKATYALSYMAQFGIPDEDAKTPLTYQLVCHRKATQ